MTTDVKLVVDACFILQIGTERFFREAYDYAEVRIGDKRRTLKFMDFVKHDIVPTVVQDYALDVLSRRTS